MGKEAAGAMSAASFIGPGLGVIGGLYGAITGAKEKRDADRALANYNRQELKNVAENLQVSTRGAEVQTGNQARLEANQVDALKGGGTRALIGGLGRVEAGSQAVAENIGINLDEQQKQIDQMKAQDEARIRAIQEGREVADIAALSSQSQAGKDAKMMGFGNIIQGAGEIGNKLAEEEPQERNISSIENTLVPMGRTDSTIPTANINDFANSYRRRNRYGIGYFPSNVNYNVAP